MLPCVWCTRAAGRGYNVVNAVVVGFKSLGFKLGFKSIRTFIRDYLVNGDRWGGAQVAAI